MREILGRRRKISLRRKERTAFLDAALTYAERWQWRVVPGAGFEGRDGQDARGRGGRGREGRDGRGGQDTRRSACACGRPKCPVPGVHPVEPGLLAATRDPRMVRWWWTRRPDAPVVLATGDRVSAASLPAVAGARALEAMDALGCRLGPVVATPTRYVFLVAPYSLAELGELLDSQDWVPTSLRYHGEGGYVGLPPAGGLPGPLKWVRQPVEAVVPTVPVEAVRTGRVADAVRATRTAERTPWLPRIDALVDALVLAGRTAPDGDRLRY
ncbi:hypothetical protein RVR_4880 [Actinacidiphila reveromycinica]|uniref:DNA primase/polymerase bifunctional N-terminal domain-containing protein n=1 Tax=Actinacidiphila reveromycinica TaxID=659352 RepID=A0A7U3UQQ3_9ACTN|nr:bifunctional DNA primase/polymerase [Streptomyces sp. SN-593]BBA98625.1 hypothetical protein RVR_4880 [Streptomyces sp. SN-593]